MNKLSVVILTKNGMPTIAKTLKSISWADEILVVDSGSTDETLNECKKYNNCKIIKTYWRGFGKQHHFAVNSCKNDTIFLVDQDETVTNQLKKKLESLLIQNELTSAYRIKRNTFYIFAMIKHCWSSDYPVRLFNRKYFNFCNISVPHEYVEGKGKRIKINQLILHYSFNSFSSHIKKMDLYTSNGAKHLFTNGNKSSIIKAVAKGIFMFTKLYILRLGFLDGKLGFILAINSAYYSYLKYLKLWELIKKENNGIYNKT